MTFTTLVNGVPAESVSSRDRGLQYGDGLFETVAVRHGAPRLWERHLERLFRDAARLGMPAPDAACLTEEGYRLCAGAERAVLKIIVTRGAAGRGYAPPSLAEPTRILNLSPWPVHPAQAAETGVAVRFCETRLGSNPRLAGIKHLNRLEQVLARSEWETDYAEGLMRDDSGNVIEGTMSNLFVVASGIVWTPDLSRCGVAGVMRGWVLDQFAGAARAAPLRCDDVVRADELFLTNSVIGIWPVSRLGDREYRVGPVTRRIMRLANEAQVCA
jgi:4-amino-4-deoxychorismate lyase